MELYTVIGLGGVGFYVGSYGLVQLGRMDGNGSAYSAMNVIAASMVCVSLLQDFNLPSMVTQITWITIGVVGLGLRAHRHWLGNNKNARAQQLLMAESADAGALAVRHPTAGVGRPPADTVPNPGAIDRLLRDLVHTSTPLARVRPQRANAHVRDGLTFDLRPDTAPVRNRRPSLGITPDVAPRELRVDAY